MPVEEEVMNVSPLVLPDEYGPVDEIAEESVENDCPLVLEGG